MTFLLMTHAQQTETVSLLTACLQLTFLMEHGSFKSKCGVDIYIALKPV